jgi:hypothetical protein
MTSDLLRTQHLPLAQSTGFTVPLLGVYARCHSQAAWNCSAGVELDGTERLLLNPMAKEFIPPARHGQTSAKCKV